MLITARVSPRHRCRGAHSADLVDDHPHLPAGATRCRDERVGCYRRRRHPGGAVGRRRAGRRAGLGVDFLRQCPYRNHRAGAGAMAGPGVAHPGAPIRPGRCGAVRGGHVFDRLRAATGPGRSLGTMDLGDGRRRHRLHVGVRLLAGRQHPRAADPAGHFRRPGLQPLQRRSRHYRVRDDSDDAAADVLHAGGVRAVADACGFGDRTDGGRQRGARAVRRRDRRPIPPAARARFRLFDAGNRADMAFV